MALNKISTKLLLMLGLGFEFPRRARSPSDYTFSQMKLISKISSTLCSSKHPRQAAKNFLYYQKQGKASGIEVVSPMVSLTEEQRSYYALARDFADREIRPNAQSWESAGMLSIETLKKCADLGFAGMTVGADYGGSEMSRVDNCIVVEGLATGCVGTTAMLTIHNMCAGLLDKFGSADQKKLWLPKLTSLEVMTSYCLTEPGSGSDAASLTTKATYDADKREYVINGEKTFISGAGVSDLYLVMCRVEPSVSSAGSGGVGSVEVRDGLSGSGEVGSVKGAGGITCFLVPKDTAGLSFGANEKKMGWKVQPTRQVILEDVHIPLENRLGAEGMGFKIAMTGLDGGRLSIGAAQICFEMAVKYTKERRQFQKAIADYQSVQFKLADMAGKIMTSRVVIRHAASLLDTNDPSATYACALAKKMATDQCFEVCNEALQLHGGYGYLQDYQIERYVRDVRVNQILEGTNEIMRHIVGRAIVS